MNNEHSELRGRDRSLYDRPGQPTAPIAAFRFASAGRALRDFTRQWLDRLGNLEFERLSQDGKVDFCF